MAYAIGGRGCRTCRVLWRRVLWQRVLWRRVPAAYKAGLLFTDFWSASAEVLPEEQHQATSKGAGQTCHIERFNNVLRQRLGRLGRLGRQRKGEDRRRQGNAFRTVEVSDGQPGPEQGEEAEEAENTHRAQWQPREDRDTPHGLEPEGFGGHTRDAALI